MKRSKGIKILIATGIVCVLCIAIIIYFFMTINFPAWTLFIVGGAGIAVYHYVITHVQCEKCGYLLLFRSKDGLFVHNCPKCGRKVD
ncbi:MAG: hypothetical protein R3Y65_00800 [Bacillota bacterium]